MVNVENDVFRSFEVSSKNGIIRIDEGDNVKFCTEAGEEVKGRVAKISGKGEKAKIQIVPEGAEKEEIWSLIVMAEGSLELDKEEEE
jgi:translation initiation factor IF-1